MCMLLNFCSVIDEKDVCHLDAPDWKEYWRGRKNESLKRYGGNRRNVQGAGWGMTTRIEIIYAYTDMVPF